jgi:hypothetical protein
MALLRKDAARVPGRAKNWGRVSFPWMPPLQATQIMASGNHALVCSMYSKVSAERNANLGMPGTCLGNPHITRPANTSRRPAGHKDSRQAARCSPMTGSAQFVEVASLGYAAADHWVADQAGVLASSHASMFVTVSP